MENQDKKLNPKPSDDAQSLVETIIPSTATEESKTTEVKHNITLETPQTPVAEKEKTDEDKAEDSENVNQKEDTEPKDKSENESPEVDSETDESIEAKDADEDNVDNKSDESSESEKNDEDEGDKIETVAP